MKYYSAAEAAKFMGLSVVTFRKKFTPDDIRPAPGGRWYYYLCKRINAAEKKHRGICEICGKPFCRLGTYWSTCSYSCAKTLKARGKSAKTPKYSNKFSAVADPQDVAFKNKIGTRKCTCGAQLYVGQHRCPNCTDKNDHGLVDDNYIYGY